MAGRSYSDDEIAKLKARVLDELEQAHSIGKACKAVGLPVRTMHNWRDYDPEFNKAFEEAVERGNDVIRDEIRRRAVDGWMRDVYFQGQVVGEERLYSDRLMELLARSRLSEFRDSRELTLKGDPTAPLKHDHKITLDDATRDLIASAASLGAEPPEEGA